MMRKVVPVLVLACSLLPALSGPGASATETPTQAASEVRLLSRGTAPRARLRLAVPEQAVAHATMELSESIEQKAGGTTINSVHSPPFRVGMQVTAGKPSPNGDLPISYGYSDTAVVNDGSLTDAQVAQYQSALAPLASLTGTATLTARNQIVDSTLAGTEGLDATTAQLVSQVSDQLGSLSSPFPGEAVGVGARWRTTSMLHLNGIDVRQVTEYTLRTHEGNQLTVDIALTQSAPRQPANFPGVPAGTKVTLTKWRSTATGHATTSLTQPGLPLSSEMHTSGTQTFTVQQGSQRSSLDQKVTADMKLSP